MELAETTLPTDLLICTADMESAGTTFPTALAIDTDDDDAMSMILRRVMLRIIETVADDAIETTTR